MVTELEEEVELTSEARRKFPVLEDRIVNDDVAIL